MGNDRLSEALVLMGIRLNMLYLSAILEDCNEDRNRARAAADRTGGEAVTCVAGDGKV